MNILIIVGEKSAENYASILIDELQNLRNDLRFFSVCSNIIDRKSEKIADYQDISVIGIKEALVIAKKAFSFLNKIKKNILEKNIDVIILIDFPEFNMRVAKFAYSKNKKIIYYINPQVWAWRSYRVKQLFKLCNLIIPILPFEKTFFRFKGEDIKKVSYFGHPIVDLVHSKNNPQEREQIVLLMPGSRRGEIENNIYVMLDACKKIHRDFNNYKFVWILPHVFGEDYAKSKLHGYDFVKISYNPYEFMKKACFGILKSGTTTLEATLFGLPMVVVYKVSNLSYIIGKLLIKNIRFISLPNLIAGEAIVKELINKDATAENIYSEFVKVVLNKTIYRNMQKRLLYISNLIGEYPVTAKIASKIVSAL